MTSRQNSATLRLAEPDRDFARLVDWPARLEDEPMSVTELIAYAQVKRMRVVQRVLDDGLGHLMGFHRAATDRLIP
jgi:hypothetical protein